MNDEINFLRAESAKLWELVEESDEELYLDIMHGLFDDLMAVWWGNLMKYIWRWARKNGREDLEKARECIDNLLEDN